MNLWVSAPSSIRNPTIQIMIPKIYKAPRFSSAELVYFWLRNSKTSPAVNVTHRPCKHQDVKNLIVLFLIFTNLLSCPVLITL